ncbi:hypothetical protein A1O3_03993 [Capronia epimyces CBS 606.96]|uniref:Uncharacterized protein n=1 Tax=Capronia epimyces CBS 606.96 TaxID=1182542 RepID=W9YCR0_9EURO|nr:uncharacterized protein A1O3_03993 [Capronia epimyces CBS 606.96]EXJ87036.1 hypothetical protein A1O3_03993 [Capronia epimyces CBS 606.96]
MAQTPAHIKHVHGPDRRISAYRDELVSVQSLYHDRRYKQCIALCEQLQRPEIHPVQQMFLWFYRAISYESIGLIAHDYSSNKLRFLYSAKENFTLALRSLPLPYMSTETGVYEQPEYSPLPSLSAIRSVSHANARLHVVSPARTGMAGMVQSASSCSNYSTGSIVLEPHKTPSTDDDSSFGNTHNPITPRLQAELNGTESGSITLPTTPATHKSRLSQSLSLEHKLADELVPSPLFSRKSKKAHITEPDEDIALRPLPPLPFSHHSNFELLGSRIVQVPAMRKTAVETLIARYEGCLPLTSSPIQSPTPTGHQRTGTVPESPVTPRFKIIRDAFTPNPVNEHLEAYLSSPDMTRYNACLSDFRMQLHNHISYLDKEIGRVHKAQDERTATKALSKTRFASFWSLEHKVSALKRKCLNSEGFRVCSSPEIENEQATRARPEKERIERLRSEGWHVRKETHGFKGLEWYENLGRCVERELTVTASKVRM